MIGSVQRLGGGRDGIGRGTDRFASECGSRNVSTAIVARLVFFACPKISGNIKRDHLLH